MKFPKNITIGTKYRPAMGITKQIDADAYFEQCVEHSMSFGMTRSEAEATERANLAYYAGYYSNATRERVEQLFHCAHPIFGAITKYGSPSPKEAFELGKQFAIGKTEEKILQRRQEARDFAARTGRSWDEILQAEADSYWERELALARSTDQKDVSPSQNGQSQKPKRKVLF